MEYGVQVDNKFAFCSDEEVEDPSDLIKKAEQEKKTPAQKKAERDEAKRAKLKAENERKAAAAAAAAGKENRPVSAGRGAPRGRGGRGGPRPLREGGDRPPRMEGDRPPRDFGERREGGEFRGRGRGGPRPFRGRGGNFNSGGAAVEGAGGDEPKEVAVDENGAPAFDSDRPRRGRGGFVSGRGRGSGGFAGGRGGRQFDRQSGSDRTGVRGQEKKDGHGKGNWGTEKDELEGETEEVKISGDEEVETAPPAPREKTAEELEQEAMEAEIAKQKTLSEYRASLQKDQAKFNTRKAGEGNEENFGKLVPLSKKEIHDDDEHEVVIVTEKSKKKVLDIDIRFADAGRERADRGERRGGPRGRGGRGGFGGGRGGGGPRVARQQPSHFNATDSDAFPALGAH